MKKTPRKVPPGLVQASSSSLCTANHLDTAAPLASTGPSRCHASSCASYVASESEKGSFTCWREARGLAAPPPVRDPRSPPGGYNPPPEPNSPPPPADEGRFHAPAAPPGAGVSAGSCQRRSRAPGASTAAACAPRGAVARGRCLATPARSTAAGPEHGGGRRAAATRLGPQPPAGRFLRGRGTGQPGGRQLRGRAAGRPGLPAAAGRRGGGQAAAARPAPPRVGAAPPPPSPGSNLPLPPAPASAYPSPPPLQPLPLGRLTTGASLAAALGLPGPAAAPARPFPSSSAPLFTPHPTGRGAPSLPLPLA